MGFYGLTINLAMSLAPLVAVGLYDRQGFVLDYRGRFGDRLGRDRLRRLIRYPKREKVPRPAFSLDRFIFGESASCGLGLFAGRYTLWDVALVRGIIW